jgi:hypothetical protein
MKQAFSLLAFFLLCSFAVNAQSGPVMTFPATTIDYGKIEKGSDKVRKFSFTNTGNEPLVIKSAKGSPETHTLTIKGEVLVPPAQEAVPASNGGIRQ